METFDKKTCWYMGDEIIAEMIKSYQQSQPDFKKLPHIIALNELIKLLPPNQIVADIGCGTGQVSQLFNNHQYFGADLDFIIDKCAKVLYPDNQYIVFDAEKDDYLAFQAADAVLMNGFIDVMQYPLQVLEKVMAQEVRYIILHRQEFTTEGKTHTIKNGSYCGETYHSIISTDDFNALLEKFDYEITKGLSCGFGNWERGGATLLLSNKLM